MSALLLGAPDCHLCHEMAAVARPVLAAFGIALRERDVHEDPELARQYRNEIPVLFVDDAEIARHRVGPEELRGRLVARGLAPL